MKLSTRARYGLMAMHQLALNEGNGPMSLNTIAEKEQLSVAYLEQLFSKLKKAGLVKSVRGAKGGYILSRPPEEIKIGEIIHTLEGDMELSCCTGDENIQCDRDNVCSTKHMLDFFQSEIEEVLDSKTLADM